MEVTLRLTASTPDIWKFDTSRLKRSLQQQLLSLQSIIVEQIGFKAPDEDGEDGGSGVIIADTDEAPAPVIILMLPAAYRDALMIFKKQNHLRLRSLRAL